MMTAMKGLDPANLRAKLCKTPQSDPACEAKKVCIIINMWCTYVHIIIQYVYSCVFVSDWARENWPCGHIDIFQEILWNIQCYIRNFLVPVSSCIRFILEAQQGNSSWRALKTLCNAWETLIGCHGYKATPNHPRLYQTICLGKWNSRKTEMGVGSENRNGKFVVIH